MRTLRALGTLALAGALLAGCGAFRSEPTPLQAAEAAVEELRETAARVTSYQADFAASFDHVAYGRYDWTGSLRAAGPDWSAASDLVRDGRAFAHLDTVHKGGRRYHKQTGRQVTLGQWHWFEGARATNYFWYVGVNRGYDTPPQALPEFDPLAYLSIERAFQVTRTDLPGGGRRYMFEGDDWVAGAPISQTWSTFPHGYTPLVIEVGGDGLPAKVEIGPFGTGGINDITMTITLRHGGTPVTVTPPPADQVANPPKPAD